MERGWDILCLPALKLQPLITCSSKIPLPQSYDLVIFVSGGAAQIYLDFLKSKIKNDRWPDSTKAATNGPASARILENSGWFHKDSEILYPDSSFPNHDSESLWNVLRGHEIKNWKILLIRADRGRDWLADKLLENGASVLQYSIYRRIRNDWSKEVRGLMIEWSNNGKFPIWLLTSKEGIYSVGDFIYQSKLNYWWSQCSFIVIHKNLAEFLQNYLLKLSGKMIICSPNDESILNAFKEIE